MIFKPNTNTSIDIKLPIEAANWDSYSVELQLMNDAKNKVPSFNNHLDDYEQSFGKRISACRMERQRHVAELSHRRDCPRLRREAVVFRTHRRLSPYGGSQNGGFFATTMTYIVA